MSKISLDRNELTEAAEGLRAAGARFSQSALQISGRKSTIVAVDALIDTFSLLQDSFMRVGEAVGQSAALLYATGDAMISEDIAAADSFSR